MTQGVTIDIPCDVHQVDGTGFVWTFLDAARGQARIAVEPSSSPAMRWTRCSRGLSPRSG